MFRVPKPAARGNYQEFQDRRAAERDIRRGLFGNYYTTDGSSFPFRSDAIDHQVNLHDLQEGMMGMMGGWVGWLPWMGLYASWMNPGQWSIWQTFQTRLSRMSTTTTVTERREVLIDLIEQNDCLIDRRQAEVLADRMLEMGRSMTASGNQGGDQESRFEDYTETVTTTTTTTQNQQAAASSSSGGGGISVTERYEAADQYLKLLTQSGQHVSMQDAQARVEALRSGRDDATVRTVLEESRTGRSSSVVIPAVQSPPPVQPRIEYQPQPVSVPQTPQQPVWSPPPVQQPVFSPPPQQAPMSPPPMAQQAGFHYQHSTMTTSSSSAFAQTPGGQMMSPGPTPQYQYPNPAQVQSPPPMMQQLPQAQPQLQIAAGPDPNAMANFNQAAGYGTPQGYAAQPEHAPQAQAGYPAQNPMQQQQQYAQSPPQQQQQQIEYASASPGPAPSQEVERTHKKDKKEKKDRGPRKYRKD